VSGWPARWLAEWADDLAVECGLAAPDLAHELGERLAVALEGGLPLEHAQDRALAEVRRWARRRAGRLDL
jgi:hypothetical protein